jgi:hypothetical protein
VLTQSVRPKPLFRRKGVAIYPIYRHDSLDGVRREYWYGYSPDCSDDGTDAFDIREVPGYNGPTGVFRLGETPRSVRFDSMEFLRGAIEEGTLQAHIRLCRCP